jgi:hypothetical protein
MKTNVINKRKDKRTVVDKPLETQLSTEEAWESIIDDIDLYIEQLQGRIKDMREGREIAIESLRNGDPFPPGDHYQPTVVIDGKPIPGSGPIILTRSERNPISTVVDGELVPGTEKIGIAT